PEGGAGKCAGKQLCGCAAATAARNSPSRKARGDAVKARTRTRRNAREARKSRAVRCALGLPSSPAREPNAPRHGGTSFVRSAHARRSKTRVNALKARWKAPRAITILMAWNSQLEDPHVQAKGRAMALDDKTRTELEAAAFRRLVEHLRKRTDVQNIDLMNLAGFCRNCLSNWMKDAADARGVPMSKDESRETIYGMPYEEWKAKHQKEASKDQQAAFEKTGHKH